MKIRISPRTFGAGLDISTPLETYSTKKPLAPFGDTHVLNSRGTQVARLGPESLFSGAYNIIISGAGFYRFSRDENSKQTWICRGEGRLLQVSRTRRVWIVIDDAGQKVAEGSKARFASDYEIALVDEAEFKLVMCIFLAVHFSEGQSAGIPD